MKLTKVEINNLFQHKHIEQEFKGHLIGVVGTNGCGKSNFLNAIHFAFAGEVPGKNKDKLLKWGAEYGNVKVDFDYNGSKCTIDRAVGKNTATFKFGDITYSGTTKVNDAIQNHLGLDKDILRMVFVKQAELDAVLFESASKRETAFQRMCGIGEATRVYKKIGDVLSDKFPPLPDYSEQIAVANEELNSAEVKLLEAENYEQELVSFLAEQNKDQIIQDKLTFQELTQKIRVLKEITQQLSLVSKAIIADQHVIDEIDTQLNGVTLEAVNAEIEATKKRLEAAKEYQRLYTNCAKKQEELNSLGNPPCDDNTLTELKTHADLVKKELVNISGAKQLYQKLSATLQTQNLNFTLCPLCGTEIQDLDTLRNRVQQELLLYNQREKSLNLSVEREYENMSKAKERYTALSKLLYDQVTEAEELLKTADVVEDNIPTLEATLNGMSSVQADLSNLIDKKRLSQTRIDINTARFSELELQNKANKEDIENLNYIKDIVASLDTEAQLQNALKVAGERAVAAENAIAGIHQHEIRLGNVRGSIAILKRNKQKLESTIEILKEKRSQQGLYSDTVKTISNVRDWFHYTKGPHDLAVSVLDELTQDVNKYLLELNAPFSVEAEDTALAYKCCFTDNRDIPSTVTPEAADLSGGQKIMLAIAFRLASYCMFANKQGILSMDEPTVYLDDTNISNFCTLLDKIKKVSEKMDLQIFISTHERAVIPFLDSVIDLSEKS